MADYNPLVESLQEEFKKVGVAWPFGEGPFEWKWKGDTRLSDIETFDSGWGSNVVSGTRESKVHKLVVMYRGVELDLSQVDDELAGIYRDEATREYLLEIVATGKTRKQRAREASEAEERRWKEVANKYFRTVLSLTSAQRLWIDLHLVAPKAAEKIDTHTLGEWMSDLSWGTYVPKVSDVLERLHEFGLPAALALPEPPAPKVETPEETRERKALEKFGRSYADLLREEKLWVLYWIIEPAKAAKIQPVSIKRWMSGKGTQTLYGIDVQKAVREGKIR